MLQRNDPTGNKIAQTESRSHTSPAAVKCLAVDGLADIMSCFAIPVNKVDYFFG